ncbi:hypothetical protein [Halegenticoccus tardaugens]|nr:hypothetical protein [Halegenticoccus tardaugens]
MPASDRRPTADPRPTAAVTIEFDAESGRIRIHRSTPLGVYTETVPR